MFDRWHRITVPALLYPKRAALIAQERSQLAPVKLLESCLPTGQLLHLQLEAAFKHLLFQSLFGLQGFALLSVARESLCVFTPLQGIPQPLNAGHAPEERGQTGWPVFIACFPYGTQAFQMRMPQDCALRAMLTKKYLPLSLLTVRQ